MASLGTLTLDLIAEVGGFTKGMDAAERRSAKFKKNVSRQIQAVEHQTKLAAVAMAGLGVAVVGMADTLGKSAAELQNYSRATGASIQSIQKLGYALKAVGSDKSPVDVIKDLSDHLGDAALTNGGVAQQLKAIGLNAKELVKLSPVAQLEKIGEAIQGLPKAQQVNILESLASDSSELVPLLANGAAGLKKFAQQAEQSGAVTSNQFNASLAEAYRALLPVEAEAKRIAQEVLVSLTPAIKQFADYLAQPGTIKSIEKFASSIATITSAAAKAIIKITNLTDTIAENIAKAVHGSADPIERVQERIKKLKAELNGSGGSGIGNALATMGGVVPGVGPSVLSPAQTASMKKELKQQESLLAEYRANVSAYGNAYGFSKPSASQSTTLPTMTVTGAAPRVAAPKSPPPTQIINLAPQAEVKSWAQANQQIVADLRDRYASGRALTKQYQQFQISQIQDTFARQQEAIKATVSDQTDAQRLLSENAAREAQQIADINGKQVSAFSDAVRTAAETMQQNFAQFLINPMQQGFKGLGSSFADMIQKMAAQIIALRLQTALFGKSFSNGGALGGLVGDAGKFLGGLFGGGSSLSSAAGAGAGGMAYAAGGIIRGPGTSTSDSILARLSNGEAVLNAAAVARVGSDFVNALNSGRRFASGGMVGAARMPKGRGTGTGNVKVEVVNQTGTNAKGKATVQQGKDGAQFIRIVLNAVANDVRQGGKVGQAILQTTTASRRVS